VDDWYTKLTLLIRGVRIALRAKINDSLPTGLRISDSIIVIGRGQRQLILGDRYTGKTTICISVMLRSNCNNSLGAIDGFGSTRFLGLYIGINQNISKLVKILYYICNINYWIIILSTHTTSASLLSFIVPVIGISISERFRDRGYDVCICLDDLIKHSKSYRQCSLLLNKIPSRDAFPADIFNVHSLLLERCGKLRISYLGGSISSFPIIETINADITEFIATNVISITDGQFYTNKFLFLNSNRPSIDSGLSVSRIGSNSQCNLLKTFSFGIKNELTNLRGNNIANDSLLSIKLNMLNSIYFQDHLFISSLELTTLLLGIYKTGGVLINNLSYIYFLLYINCFNYLYNMYIIFMIKFNSSLQSALLVSILFIQYKIISLNV
jgi:F-type H+-transporting ATPase subunit alpha